MINTTEFVEIEEIVLSREAVDDQCAIRGWTLGHLAEVAGLHENTMRNSFTGAFSCTFRTLAKVANALQVAPGTLLEIRRNGVEKPDGQVAIL